MTTGIDSAGIDSAGIDAARLQVCLAVLREVDALAPEHPDAVRVREATAAVFKSVKLRRRAERQDAAMAADLAVTAATATGAPDRIETPGVTPGDPAAPAAYPGDGSPESLPYPNLPGVPGGAPAPAPAPGAAPATPPAATPPVPRKAPEPKQSDDTTFF